MQVPVAWTIAADARGEVQPTAGLAGQVDGVLHGAVGQPARIAPVQPLTPGLEELVEGGEDGTLLLAHSLGFVEVEPVLPMRRLVGEHDAWGQTGHSAGSAGSPPAPSPAPAGAARVPNPSQMQALGQGPPPGWHSRRLRTRLLWACSCQQRVASDILWHGDTGAQSWGHEDHPHGDSTGTHGDAQTMRTGMQGPPHHGRMDHGPGDTQTVVPGRHGPPLWGRTDHHHGDAQATGTGTQGPASRGCMDHDPRTHGPPTWGWMEHCHGNGWTTGTRAPPPPQTTVTGASGDKLPREGGSRGQGGGQGHGKGDVSPALGLAVEPGLSQVPRGK